METSVLLWFKNDLRLLDNETLVKATASNSKILPVYCIDPRHFASTKLGFPKADYVRFDFLKQCLLDLRENLRKMGAHLMILVGKPEEQLLHLVKKYDCNTIYTEQEFATEELAVLKNLKNNLPSNCELHTIWGRTLYHIDDIPYKIKDIPLTSKAFRIQTQKATNPRETFEIPKEIQVVSVKSSDWGEFPKPSELGFSDQKNYALTYMEGGESKALERLHYYFFETEHLTNYRWTRNKSLGLDYSSKFSPYMALGCISPRTIYEEVKKYEDTVKKNQSTWWLIFEIVWRDYFTFKLMKFQNEIYSTEGYTDKTIDFENNTKLFERWCSGQTGIPFVDAHMRQLNETGFMSNRGRVNCSSFLAHDYKIDWTWGAAYFESKLSDYDVGSNWMNWHTQTYQIWYTNPIHQGHKYKEYDFVKKWIPELIDIEIPLVLIPWYTDEFKKSKTSYPKPYEVLKKWNRSIQRILKESSSLQDNEAIE